MFQKPFSFKGRITRTEYGISIIIYAIITAIINSIETIGKVPVIIYIVYIPLLWFIWAQGAKRCHDIGNSGWCQIIPFYLFWMLFGKKMRPGIPLKLIILESRIIVGLTFIFSGFVKAVDPVGSMIKFNEYFDAFHAPFFQPLSLFFGIALCSLEFILGVSLIFGSRIRLISWLTLILMSFFTVQTFILAIWNPVSDCGCFGDAIKLTNWQTFFKNIILIAIVIFIFINRKKIIPVTPGAQWITIIIASLFILGLSLYSYFYQPLIDFRPYKSGNDIFKLKTIPKGKHPDIYRSFLMYKNKKTGEITNFDENNIPMDTNTWKFIETNTKLVEKGYTPPTRDFKFFDMQGNEWTDSFFNQKGYRLLIVQENLEKSNLKAQCRINNLVNEIGKNGKIKIWALTSSLSDVIVEYSKKNNLQYSFYTADPVILKTIDRSNPAILLFKDNIIIRHYPARGIPGYKKLIDYIK